MPVVTLPRWEHVWALILDLRLWDLTCSLGGCVKISVHFGLESAMVWWYKEWLSEYPKEFNSWSCQSLRILQGRNWCMSAWFDHHVYHWNPNSLLGCSARLATSGRMQIINEMVTDLFKKMAEGKVTWSDFKTWLNTSLSLFHVGIVNPNHNFIHFYSCLENGYPYVNL